MLHVNLGEAIDHALRSLRSRGRRIDTGHWQGQDVSNRPDMVSWELLDYHLAAPVPSDLGELQQQCRPNLPWADEHFAERVSRVPSNPGEAYKRWPFWREQTAETMENGRFSHSYQERFWPKRAGEAMDQPFENRGIWYEYGDLDDVVSLLRRHHGTRQAYLPMFSHEDTGALHGGRVPCSLGWWFVRRDEMLHCVYSIRCCDAHRHLRDDVYLAARLLLWVLAETGWSDVKPGVLTMHIFSFHEFAGDRVPAPTPREGQC